MENDMVFIIITSGAELDNDELLTPECGGCFFSLARAQSRLETLIARNRKLLNSHYDTEAREANAWEIYEDGNADRCFLRIEIIAVKIEDWMVE